MHAPVGRRPAKPSVAPAMLHRLPFPPLPPTRREVFTRATGAAVFSTARPPDPARWIRKPEKLTEPHETWCAPVGICRP